MKEISDYDKQALKFLETTKTTFKAVFLKNDFYFEGDKEKRDIYTISLKRGEREYIFKFGNSINASGEYIFFGKAGHEAIHLKTNVAGKKILRYEGVALNGGNSQKNKDFEEPTPYMVLASMQKYDPSSFKDFCSEFGYNEDSRSAERTYKAVQEEFNNLKMLFSDDEIEKMQEIQ